MMREMCKSKIEHATVTDANLKYEGSITIDETLMEAASIVPYEKVQVVNLSNGARLETYVIPGKRRSGVICLNGPAARLGHPGDRVHVISYCLVPESELKGWKPTVVSLTPQNKIKT